MRIIDKQHDFYDYLQDSTDTIVFDRRNSFLLTKEIVCRKLGFYSFRDSKYRFMLLQCGVAYWLFLITVSSETNYLGDPVDYEVELLDHWKNYKKPNKLINISFVSFNLNIYDFKLKDINIPKMKDHISDLRDTIDWNDYRSYVPAIGDADRIPLLKACGISQLIDPIDIFCTIEEHFSMLKTASETTEAKGATNNDKIIMHGFDVKTSFRNMA